MHFWFKTWRFNHKAIVSLEYMVLNGVAFNGLSRSWSYLLLCILQNRDTYPHSWETWSSSMAPGHLDQGLWRFNHLQVGCLQCVAIHNALLSSVVSILSPTSSIMACYPYPILVLDTFACSLTSLKQNFIYLMQCSCKSFNNKKMVSYE